MMPEKLSRRNFLRRLTGAPVIVPASVGLTTSGLWVPEAKALSPGADYHFWVHGTSVQVENPELVKSMKRFAFGTHVSQDPGSANWFHFAIPTPTVADGSQVTAEDVYLRVWMDFDVLINEVHVFDGERRWPGAVDTSSLPHRGQRREEFLPFDIGDLILTRGGLGVSVLVGWLAPAGGEIHFIAAGARFET